MFNLFPGQGLGEGPSRLFAFGLGSLFEIEIIIEPKPTVTAGGGGGGEQRTYLFIPQTVKINVGFRGTVHESHFSVPKIIGKVFAKRVPLLVKAKGDKDGLS